MIPVIVSLIFLAATSGDVVETLSDAAFAPVSNPLKITRIHYNPQEEEVYREYLYKDKDKIRIDIEYGNGETYTSYVYDGKSGYIEGGAVTREASIEIVLFGCPCGYLGGMEKVTSVYHEGVDAVYATGKQGNKLYLNNETKLPLRFELDNSVVVFDDYTKVEGIGLMPFLIVEMRLNEIVEMTRIAGVERRVSLPRNFFSVPQQEVETLD
jgi:hypothetical protein